MKTKIVFPAVQIPEYVLLCCQFLSFLLDMKSTIIMHNIANYPIKDSDVKISFFNWAQIIPLLISTFSSFLCIAHTIYSVNLAMASQNETLLDLLRRLQEQNAAKRGLQKNVTGLNMTWQKQRNVWVQKLHYCSSNLEVWRGWWSSLVMKLASWRPRNEKSRPKKSYWIRYSNIVSFISFLCHLSYVLSLFLIFHKCSLSCIAL